MRITNIEASLHRIAITYPLLAEPEPDLVVVTRVETAEGIVGRSLIRGRDPIASHQYIQNRYAPELIDKDPRNTEHLWQKIFWEFNQRARTGIVVEAASAVDMALWDVKAQAAGMPLWQILGGGQQRVKVYATVNGPDYTLEEYVEVAKQKVADGHRMIKVAVATDGGAELDRDVQKIAVLREALGPDIGLAIDANCLLNLQSAVRLARCVERYNLAWFEEPLHNNEPSLSAQLRRMTTIPISAGQAEAFSWNFRDLIAGGDAYDLMQIDLGYIGGYTEALKVAALLQAHHLEFSTHGSPIQSMHIVGAVANGKTVECHLNPHGIDSAVFGVIPTLNEGYIDLPTTPGLGVQWNLDYLEETKVTR